MKEGSKGLRKIGVVEVSGSNYEMGFQYGSACPQIKKMVQVMSQNLEMDLDKIKAFSKSYIPAIQGYDAGLMDEIKGIAEGAKVDVEEIIFLTAWYEMAIFKSATTLVGCTSFAAVGEATIDGELIIGQNLDMVPTSEEMLILLRMKPEKGPKILALATLGALGLICINSAGLSVNGNMLVHKDFLSPAGIVPHNVIARKTMSCRSLSRAILAIGTARRGPAVHQLFGSSEGDVISVEVTPDDLGFIYPVDGIFAHSNNFLTERLKSGDMVSTIFPDSFIRVKRLDTLMRRHKGTLSVDLMKEFLQDHNNYPDSICRHADEDLPPNWQVKTIASIVSCPKRQKMHIALGNPCENEYIEYELQ
jgi:isopenicillin-N N-acyltransferase-like protein